MTSQEMMKATAKPGYWWVNVAKAQATIRSRASNNARAAEHHANLMAIWERKQ